MVSSLLEPAMKIREVQLMRYRLLPYKETKVHQEYHCICIYYVSVY